MRMMSLVPANRWWAPLSRTSSGFDSEIDRFMDGFFDDFDSVFPRFGFPKALGDFKPATDIKEKDGHFLVNIDLPGVSKKDIKVELKDGLLTVSGERKHEEENKEGSVHRIERSYGSFTRSFAVPEGADEDRLEASYENGVLSLVIPKGVVPKGRQIEVKEGKGSLLGRLLGKGKKEEQGSKEGEAA